jgi:hypothetical protein
LSLLVRMAGAGRTVAKEEEEAAAAAVALL